MAPIEFHIREKKIPWKSMAIPSTVWLSIFVYFFLFFLCVCVCVCVQQKEEIHTGLKQLEGE